MNYLIKKEVFWQYILSLRNKYDVIAPVLRNLIKYDYLEKDDRVILETPVYSARRFFLPDKEVLFNFEDNKIKKENKLEKKRIMFMARTDVSCLYKVGLLFLSEPQDPYFKDKVDNTLIIELPITPSKSSFFSSMNLRDYYDIKIMEHDKDFYVKGRTEKGRSIINNKFKKTKLELEDNTQSGRLIEIKKFEEHADVFNSPVWKKWTDKCLSCGACTIACTTCLCFRIEDKLDLPINKGSRIRNISSCQLRNFSEVAGGFAFRDERERRFKHRILHKLRYFKEKFGEHMCSGCGRCIDVCPTGIDMVKIVEEINRSKVTEFMSPKDKIKVNQ